MADVREVQDALGETSDFSGTATGDSDPQGFGHPDGGEVHGSRVPGRIHAGLGILPVDLADLHENCPVFERETLNRLILLRLPCAASSGKRTVQASPKGVNEKMSK